MEINSNTSKPSNTGLSGLGNSQRPGEYLRQIRMTQKKELSEVAQELKINEKQLTALEQDDYKSLPEAPFIKGYYRAYAKFLNVDATILIQRFEEIYSSDTGLPANHALKDSPIKTMGRLASSGRRGMNKWIKRLLWLILIVAICWALWAVLNNWMGKRQVTEMDVQDTAAIEVLPTSNTALQSGTRLHLEFKRPTSVMITDVEGKTLAQGRQASTLDLSGQPPFSIRLDDANAVKLKLNDETIALSSYTNSSGVADFRLSP